MLLVIYRRHFSDLIKTDQKSVTLGGLETEDGSGGPRQVRGRSAVGPEPEPPRGPFLRRPGCPLLLPHIFHSATRYGQHYLITTFIKVCAKIAANTDRGFVVRNSFSSIHSLLFYFNGIRTIFGYLKFRDVMKIVYFENNWTRRHSNKLCLLNNLKKN